MKLFIRDLSSILVRDERRVRFSVTYADDDGEPVATELGWTIDQDRHIRPPANRTFQGRYYPVVEFPQKTYDRIHAAVSDMKFVNEVLGPKVEKIDSHGNEKSEEEAEA